MSYSPKPGTCAKRGVDYLMSLGGGECDSAELARAMRIKASNVKGALNYAVLHGCVSKRREKCDDQFRRGFRILWSCQEPGDGGRDTHPFVHRIVPAAGADPVRTTAPRTVFEWRP